MTLEDDYKQTNNSSFAHGNSSRRITTISTRCASHAADEEKIKEEEESKSKSNYADMVNISIVNNDYNNNNNNMKTNNAAKFVAYEDQERNLNHGIDLEAAMIQSVYENPQCLFLSRGERTFGTDQQQLRQNLTEIECFNTYQMLRRNMDWIGRTETLSNETLPLLTNIMFRNPDLGRQFPKSNASPQNNGFVQLSNLTSETRKALEKISALDQQLYNRAQHDYSIHMWSK